MDWNGALNSVSLALFLAGRLRRQPSPVALNARRGRRTLLTRRVPRGRYLAQVAVAVHDGTHSERHWVYTKRTVAPPRQRNERLAQIHILEQRNVTPPQRQAANGTSNNKSQLRCR